MLLESNNLPNTVIRFTNVPNVDTGDEISENKDSDFLNCRESDIGHFHSAMQFKD